MYIINPSVACKAIRVLVLSLFLSIQTLSIVEAQCPMCKASVESNIAKGETQGAGLNKGILLLLVVPYLAAATIGFAYYRNYRLRKKRQANILPS